MKRLFYRETISTWDFETIREARAYIEKRLEAGDCVVNPSSGDYIRGWDVITSGCVDIDDLVLRTGCEEYPYSARFVKYQEV